MVISVRPQHLKRYKDISLLLIKYGRGDLVRDAGLDDVSGDRTHGSAEDGKPDQLAADLERLGPTYIKLGQLMSTRGDLLPAPYVDALSLLQIALLRRKRSGSAVTGEERALLDGALATTLSGIAQGLRNTG